MPRSAPARRSAIRTRRSSIVARSFRPSFSFHRATARKPPSPFRNKRLEAEPDRQYEPGIAAGRAGQVRIDIVEAELRVRQPVDPELVARAQRPGPIIPKGGGFLP